MIPAAIVIGIVTFVAALATLALVCIRKRNAHLWLPAWFKKDWAGMRKHNPRHGAGPTHILFCIADHFEPAHARPGVEAEQQRVTEWREAYPRLFSRFRDADGRPPQHTFFFPVEEYRPQHLEQLAGLTAAGYGEVEVHIHHRDDTSEQLRRALLQFVEHLKAHGLLGRDAANGQARFGFVHGNWALDNSLPNGEWCGVNDELRVLAACGCYADFTLPAAQSPAQTRRINSIYYAADDPERPKSHDRGIEVEVGKKPSGDLMLIQGPLSLCWPGQRLFGLAPAVDNADLGTGMPPSPERADAWVRTRVCVAGRPEWVFVKLHTHGCNDRLRPLLLGKQMVQLHEYLTTHYNDGEKYQLHYVTAREMYNIVKAAEQGLTGNPTQYRDMVIPPPPCKEAVASHMDHEMENASIE